jgi:hypothetical protein
LGQTNLTHPFRKNLNQNLWHLIKTLILQTEEKRKSDRKKSKKVGKNVSKKQPKKGELDLDDLRKNKEINKIVEKQLRYSNIFFRFTFFKRLTF